MAISFWSLNIGLILMIFVNLVPMGLLDAILDLLKRRLLENVTEARKAGGAALHQLKSIMMRHARMLNENRAIPLVVFSDGIYAGDPERKARVAEIITIYLPIVCQAYGETIELREKKKLQKKQMLSSS